MKTVVIVAPHFLPSFLPSVHRSRLWAYHLQEFGWKPVILTTDPAYYECQVLPEMLELLPPGLEIIRTRAIPTKPIRLIGDIATRSMFWYRCALAERARGTGFDFLLFTIPASMAALLGPGIYRRFGIPYGVDYIDPWVPETPQADRFFSKMWLAHRLSKVFEPMAVRDARLITGINTRYFESVLRRNPHLVGRVETAGMPYGGSERDYEALDRKPRATFLFDPHDGNIHLIYAGALLPKAFGIADQLLQAVKRLAIEQPELGRKLRIHFVGTGLYENDPTRGHTVQPFIAKHGVESIASELPSRIGYLDVLNHLRQSAGVLVLGSTEIHYSPSKLYQSVMSRRPVFALLHQDSTAVPTFRASRAGRAVTFDHEGRIDTATLVRELASFIAEMPSYSAEGVDWAGFAAVSARESSRILAEALDRAFAREKAERAGLNRKP